MEMEMKNSEFIEFYNGLTGLKDLMDSADEPKFAYAVARNKNKNKDEAMSLEEASQPSKSFLEFQKKHIELCNKYCDKDENGNPDVMQVAPNVTSWKGLGNSKIFKKKAKALENKHDKAIRDNEKRMKKYNKVLEDKIKVFVHQVDFSEVPSGITAGQTESILWMIKDEEE